MQVRYHYYALLQIGMLSVEGLRGGPLTYPSPENQEELAFSKDPQFCGSLRSPWKPQASCIPAEAPRMSWGLLRIPPPKGYVFGIVQLAQASQSTLTFDPFPSSYCSSLVCLVLGLPFSSEGKVLILTSSSTQKQTEVSIACHAWVPNVFSSLSLPPNPAPHPTLLSSSQTRLVRPSSTTLLFRHWVSEPSRPAPLPLPVGQCWQRQLPGSQQPPERGRHQPQPGAAWPAGGHRWAQGLRAQPGHWRRINSGSSKVSMGSSALTLTVLTTCAYRRLLGVPQGVIWSVSCLSSHLLAQISGMFFGGRPALFCLSVSCCMVHLFWALTYSSLEAEDHSLALHVILLLLLESCWGGGVSL